MQRNDIKGGCGLSGGSCKRGSRNVFKAAYRPPVDAVNTLAILNGEANHEDFTIVWTR